MPVSSIPLLIYLSKYLSVYLLIMFNPIYVILVGVNSGVMLMNLTRIRDFDWMDTMDEYLTIYKYNITFGDQDLLNILFYNYPG